MPSAKTFLEGKDSVKPLQHNAEALRRFLNDFEEIPLAPQSAAMVVQLGVAMKKPDLAAAHNAAHQALMDTRKLVSEGGAPELAKHAHTIESIFNSRAPHIDTVKGISHPPLQEALKPLVSYLERFGSFLNGWAGNIIPSRMRPKGDDAITPAQHRSNAEAARKANPDVPAAECGDPNCTIDHSAGVAHGRTFGAGSKEHVHGPGCDHENVTPTHPSAPRKGKLNTALWSSVTLGTLGAGAYLINQYGKTPAGSDPSLTPEEIERKKTREQKARDGAYVVNHAISCGLTDMFIQPFAGAYVQTLAENDKLPKSFKWVTRIFESHDHHGPDHQGHDHHAHTDHHGKPAGFWRGVGGNAKHWFLGEALGDIGAVPLTILVQRTQPGFMNGLRRIMEPVAGGLFRRGARNDAREWALEKGMDPNGAEEKAFENKMYENEISHLPQAVVWNTFSIPINLGVQRAGGSRAGWGVLALGKVFGSVVSNTALIGGRALSPGTFEKWDKYSSRHFLLPVTTRAEEVFGVDGNAAGSADERQKNKQGDDWKKRVMNASAPTGKYIN